ncbi:MAG TPA: extracellular solute-binding protein [Mycobacteriales bacterium]|nr:extracellular solute-binding protein [Mycobacteriales bacterium]
MTATGELSRRSALQAMAAAGLGLGLAACTDTSNSSDSSESTVVGDFTIPDSGAKLPKGDTTLRWVDSGDQKAVFFKQFFDAYHQKHSNISIHYDGTNWNAIQQQITLGVRNGTAPDVFQLPAQMPKPDAVKNGWVGAVDDIVPNWPEVKKRYPKGMFVNGVTDFDGKTYGMPFTSNNRINNMLLFNVDYAEKAGYDLAHDVLSWDGFRAAARKLTKQGDGKYYGIIFGLTQAGTLSGPASMMAEMSGLRGGVDAGNTANSGIDWKTGNFNYTNDLAIEIVETLLALKQDGSVVPGSTSIDDPGARERMPQGSAALMFSGPWVIRQWKQDNADFRFGLNVPPQQNVHDIRPLSIAPGGPNQWFYSSRTKYGAVIGDLYNYIASLAGQKQWAKLDGSADPAAFPAALRSTKFDALESRALDIGRTYTRLRPDPAARNTDVTKVYREYVAPSPNFNDTLVGLYTGQVHTSVPKAMKSLQDRSEQALEKAIAKARSRGAHVSRDDWVFPDWDPQQPYTKLYQN